MCSPTERPTFEIQAAQTRVGDALSVSDLVIGKAGNLQVWQLVQVCALQIVAIGLEPEQVGQVIEWGQVCEVVLGNIHVAQMDVGP